MKVIKTIIGEIFFIVFLLFMLVITIGFIISTLAYIFKKYRVKVKEGFVACGRFWERIGKHYKYLLLIGVDLFSDLKRHWDNWQLKRQIDKYWPEENITKAPVWTRSRSYYTPDLDPVSIFLLVYYSPYLIWALVNLFSWGIVAATATTAVIVRDIEKPKKQPIEMNIEYEPTEADKQETEYCPCIPYYELGKVDSDFLNAGLVDPDTGEIKYSKKYYISKEGFKPRHVQHKWRFQLENEKIKFKMPSLQTVYFNPYQAFQLLDQGFLTFMFDDKGNLLANQTEKIKRLEIK